MMVRYYRMPVLLIEFLHDKIFSFQSAWDISEDVTPNIIISKLSLLALHFLHLRIVWSRSLHATAEIFASLKANQDEPMRPKHLGRFDEPTWATFDIASHVTWLLKNLKLISGGSFATINHSVACSNSHVVNYEFTMVKEHLHPPKDHNSLKRVIDEYYNQTDQERETKNHKTDSTSSGVFPNQTRGKEHEGELMTTKHKISCDDIRTAPLLSNVFNFETSFMKEHIRPPKKQSSVNQKLTSRLPPLSPLTENAAIMKDRVRKRKSTTTTTPLTPNTPEGSAVFEI
ncbi:hypothetical protein POM88_015933 [Heracleum sosnowskyi]|uniref:ERCC4 domain-containing protein n=1 Tax=Heracleum sosnowskyi TaxID=360622 RepID=A0AAD8IL63_9APIA|nr:hypothetical protein POM88_015933 [Heracleum sosnowskyi]